MIFFYWKVLKKKLVEFLLILCFLDRVRLPSETKKTAMSTCCGPRSCLQHLKLYAIKYDIHCRNSKLFESLRILVKEVYSYETRNDY